MRQKYYSLSLNRFLYIQYSGSIIIANDNTIGNNTIINLATYVAIITPKIPLTISLNSFILSAVEFVVLDKLDFVFLYVF